MTTFGELFYPSGLNNSFQFEMDLAFSDYIQKTREMITQARADIALTQDTKILDANAPFEWRPMKKTKRGLLLIHGLYDSPCMVRDLGNYFSSQGFLVRSILLPGHGTVPGDLLNVHYSEWLKAVDYGVETLAHEVEQISIVGFSLGGVLALNKALRDSRIYRIILISPALTLKNQGLISLLLHWQRFVSFLFPKTTPWYQKSSIQSDYAKYESFPYNAVKQIHQLICKTRQLARKHKLSIPIFIAVSEDDEVISAKDCLKFFTASHHSSSQLLWYTHMYQTMQDPRITIKSSAFPEQRILDFSHICLPIAPNNLHYGRRGDYQHPLKYPKNKLSPTQKIFSGALSHENLEAHIMKRLTYNPDFWEMAIMMGKFLREKMS